MISDILKTEMLRLVEAKGFISAHLLPSPFLVIRRRRGRSVKSARADTASNEVANPDS